MDRMVRNLLLTGRPGCGKTTLVREVVHQIPTPSRGFYTVDIRDSSGVRTGFDIVTLDGRRGKLARVAGGGRYRVGRYRVTLEDLEQLAVPAIRPDGTELLVIDEIGPMECFSPLFTRAVTRALACDQPVLGTVAVAGGGFIGDVRKRADVELVEVTAGTRDKLVRELVARLSGTV